MRREALLHTSIFVVGQASVVSQNDCIPNNGQSPGINGGQTGVPVAVDRLPRSIGVNAGDNCRGAFLV
jgi:hypothetical protein